MVLANGGRYIGDYGEDSLVVIPFDTTNQTGNKVTRTVLGTIKIYKNGSTTEKTTANGVIDTNDFDSQVGINLVTIDTSNDTGDVGFWAPGNDYMVMLIDATVDTKTVSLVLGHFSLENRVTDLVRINGSRTNSNDAVLKLKQLDITHDANDHALILQGHGTGSGVYSEGGATGIGIQAKGGVTSGNGVSVTAPVSNAFIVSSPASGIDISGSPAISIGGGGIGVAISTGGNCVDMTGGAKGVNIHPAQEGINIASGANTSAVKLIGNGTKNGLEIWGGGTGSDAAGIKVYSENSAAVDLRSGVSFGMWLRGSRGLRIEGSSAQGILCTGNDIGAAFYGGSGQPGIYAEGGPYGHGFQAKGNNNKSGIFVTGGDDGNGITVRGGTTGIGLDIQGGSSSGIGLKAHSNSGVGVELTSNSNTALRCASSNGTGASFEGNGSGGKGIQIKSSANQGLYIEALGGSGIRIYGSGPALNCNSATEAAAIFSGGANKDGMTISGNGSGHGIRLNGGTSGHGIYAVGGSNSGTGIYAHGQAPNGVGIEATGSGSGKGMLISNTSPAGVGMKIRGGNGGSGLFLDVKDGNGHGIRTVGIGTGSGISSESDATGFSISTIGGIKVISNSNQHGMLIQGDGVSHAGLKVYNSANKDIDAKEITDILDDTNEIQSKLPVGNIAGSDDVESILNNTRFVASVPSYFLIPATGNNVYELKVHFYNDAGSMEDPNFNEFSIRTRTVDGTVKNALLYKEYAATNPLDVSTILSGYLALERITVGIYHCYIKITSTETDTQFLYDFACQEGVYAVTFIEGANGSITGEKIQSVNPSEDCEPVTAVPDTGYHFDDWSGDLVSSDNPLTVTNVTEDMNITADFAINQYDVTFIEGADGSITGDKNQVIDHGSDCTSVEAVPDVDFVFDGWTGDITSSDNPLTVTNVTGDLDITANFVSADINSFAFNNSQQQNNNNE